MSKSMTMGLATVLFAAGMAFSGSASANLGTCGPANDGQIKTFSYYHSNGRLHRYYEFTCFNPNWEMTAFWECNAQGYCINLS